MGNHAVTVLGYREGGEPLKPFDAPDMPQYLDMAQYKDIYPRKLFLRSSAINAIFCHDDQIGPYSLMSFPDEYSPALTTDWGKTDKYGPIDAKVLSILIPCSPKIRIRFSKMYDIVKTLNHVLMYDYNKLFGCQVTWDIRLETVCQLKAKLRSLPADELSSEVKYRILSTSMPRYIWVVDQYLYKNGVPIKNNSLGVSYLFDATDIENSDFLMMAIHYQQEAYIVNRVSFTLQPQDQNLLPPPYIVRKLMDAYYRDDKDKIFVSSK